MHTRTYIDTDTDTVGEIQLADGDAGLELQTYIENVLIDTTGTYAAGANCAGLFFKFVASSYPSLSLSLALSRLTAT